MLYPILRRFVSAFDGNLDTAFWKHVVYRQNELCGQDDIYGWLTAFWVWTNKGKWNAGPLPELLAISRPDPTVVESVSRPDFVKPTPTPTPTLTRRMRLAKLVKIISAPFRVRARKSGDRVDQRDEAAEDTTAECDDPPSQSILTVGQCRCSSARADTEILTTCLSIDGFRVSYTLDGVPYFTIAVGSIPAGYAEVDVTVVDNQEPSPCKMIVGHLATAATAKEPGGVLDTIAPAPQWFMIEKKTS